MKKYGIWSIVTKGWVFECPSWNGWKPIISTYRTKKAAKAAIRDDMVHEKDYAVKVMK